MGRKAKVPYIQLNLGDRFLNLSKRGQDAIRKSRLGHFGDEIFPLIDPDDFMVLYSDIGRGPADLQRLVAAFLIMRMENITVDELMLRIDSDIAIQYALNTTSSDKQPVSRRNLFYFMAKLDTYEQETGINLIEECFKKITGSLVKDMGLDGLGTSGRVKKRMDSMMIHMGAAHLTRLGIIYQVNQDAITLYAGLMGKGGIVPSLHHYFDESDRNAVIYHNKNGMDDKLSQLLSESQIILYLMSEKEWHEFQEYKNLVRCMNDQSETNEDGTLIPKRNKEIKGTGLQSPKDPEATARTKAGKTHVGYVGNVTEVYDGKGNGLVIDADIQQNSHSDSDFMKEYIEAKDPESGEEQVTVDGAYYSGDNAKAAAEKGILITPTSLTGTPTNPLCGEFELSADGTSIVKCPNGKEPRSQVYHEDTGKIDAKFSHCDCGNCPLHDQCPCKNQKNAVKVSLSKQMVERAELQESLGRNGHKQAARERNGVEAIPSIFRRKYGIDEIGTFIKSRIRSAYFAICIAYNGQKHQKFLKNHRVECALFA